MKLKSKVNIFVLFIALITLINVNAEENNKNYAKYSEDEIKATNFYNNENYTEAFPLFKKSAENGRTSSMSTIGVMYREGKGVLQDYAESEKWLRKAAEKGDAAGQINMGFAYEYGRGVQKDYVFAHMWFNIASVNSNDIGFGRIYRSSIEELMSPSQISEAQQLAKEWVKAHPK